jgi:hypothetical protein
LSIGSSATATTCESAPTIIRPSSPGGFAKDSITKLEALKNSEDDRAANNQKTEKYKNRPGYSSGGSSIIYSSDEEEAAAAAMRAVPTRHDKLMQLKQELAANGDLAQTFVRIEVSRPPSVVAAVVTSEMMDTIQNNTMYARKVLDLIIYLSLSLCVCVSVSPYPS